MELKDQINNLQSISIELKRRYPTLTTDQCLTLATRMQKNEMFRQALEFVKKKIY